VIVIPEPTQQFFHGPPTLRVPSVDIRLLEVTTRKGWESEPVAVTYETLRTDPLAWAGMFFRDWDRVPPRTLRDEALVRMTVRYRRVVDAPRVWCTMGPRDWDEVPQPIRAMAFMNMVARWEACLDVARRMGLAEDVLVARLRAVAMAESWFEHRALSENANGSSDLGLAQATTATRRILRTRAAQGTTDLRFDDEEYLDPLKGSRVLVYWFGLMLDETGQDLDRATRAYHVGSGSARDLALGLKRETRSVGGRLDLTRARQCVLPINVIRRSSTRSSDRRRGDAPHRRSALGAAARRDSEKRGP
jgi:hypothetical protein